MPLTNESVRMPARQTVYVLDLLIHAARQASAENVCLHPPICDLFVTTRMSRYPDRIHVIMVGEELGY